MEFNLRQFLKQIIDLRPGTNVKGTIDTIRKNIAIRGFNVWILGAAAVIASIGLDTNSEAVIIGAMLISPLMSPILGVGLSIGINDRETLMHSLENLAIAVLAVLGMSTLYFLVSPFAIPTEQILARTRPTLLDVFIGFFGGVAGIVAVSRKEITNAIPGVAIATALMPPLCVTGFGLATWQPEIFLGAFYLFFLNSVFISLSTYLIVRFLNFPYVEFVDAENRGKMTRWMIVFVVLLIIPSTYLFYTVIRDIRMERRAGIFIEKEIETRGLYAFDPEIVHNRNLMRTTDTVRLVISGSNYLDSTELAELRSLMPEYGLSSSYLDLVQVGGEQTDPEQVATIAETRAEQRMLKLLDSRTNQLDERDMRIRTLEQQFDSLERVALGFDRVQRELRLLYPDLESIAFGEAVVNQNGATNDTLPLFVLDWSPRLDRQPRTRNRYDATIGQWLKVRMQLDTVKVTEEQIPTRR